MAVSTFADYLALAKRERDISDLRRQLHVAIDSGHATELMLQRERDVSAERRALHRQIDALRTELWPSRQQPARPPRRSRFLKWRSRLSP
jgi:hypothetical protein